LNRYEDTIQRGIVNYLRAVLPNAIVLHIPNAPRSKITGARLKGLGMLKGAPDLLVCLPGGRGVFLEVKSEKGRATPEQKDFAGACAALAWDWFLVRSIDDVRKVFADLGIKTRAAA
jgi:hypothetical protein